MVFENKMRYDNFEVLVKDSQEPFEHKINYNSSNNGSSKYFLKVYESLNNNKFAESNIREVRINIP